MERELATPLVLELGTPLVREWTASTGEALATALSIASAMEQGLARRKASELVSPKARGRASELASPKAWAKVEASERGWGGD